MSLLTARSREAYYQILYHVFYGKLSNLVSNRLRTNDLDLNYPHWANHKSYPIIAAGLNKHCSGIPNVVFEQVVNHTNSIEQTHMKSYQGGMKLQLLDAISSYVL
jgi:hypothetical protein